MICRPQMQVLKASSSDGSMNARGQDVPAESLADVMSNIFSSLADMAGATQSNQQAPVGAHVWVKGVGFHPPGSDAPLLEGVDMNIQPNTLGLVYGCSGGGKSTLLTLLAGLSQQTNGTISFTGPGGPPCDSTGRMKDAGLVFQFPERHFLGDTLAEELTVAWPMSGPNAAYAQHLLSQRTERVMDAVGLRGISLDTKLEHLSGGYKRRVSLAVQLVRQPKLLLLDEPLAGLDWRARHDLVGVLSSLRRECTVLVVSHDLGEISTLVDASWRMHRGGTLSPS